MRLAHLEEFKAVAKFADCALLDDPKATIRKAFDAGQSFAKKKGKLPPCDKSQVLQRAFAMGFEGYRDAFFRRVEARRKGREGYVRRLRCERR